MNENVVIIRQTHTHSLVSMMTISLSLSLCLFSSKMLQIKKLPLKHWIVLFSFFSWNPNQIEPNVYITYQCWNKQTKIEREKEWKKMKMSCHVMSFVCVCVFTYHSLIMIEQEIFRSKRIVYLWVGGGDNHFFFVLHLCLNYLERK